MLEFNSKHCCACIQPQRATCMDVDSSIICLSYVSRLYGNALNCLSSLLKDSSELALHFYNIVGQWSKSMKWTRDIILYIPSIFLLLTVRLEIWLCYASSSSCRLEPLASSRDEEQATKAWETHLLTFFSLLFLRTFIGLKHRSLWRHKRLYTTFLTYAVVLPITWKHTLMCLT